jgi:hypothetical protein
VTNVTDQLLAMAYVLIGAIAGGGVTLVLDNRKHQRYRSSILSAFAGQLEILETSRPQFDGKTLYTVSPIPIFSIIETFLSAGVLDGKKDWELLKAMTAMLSLTTSFNQLAASVTDAVASHSYDPTHLEAMYGNIDQLTAVIESYRLKLMALLKDAGISPMIYEQGDRSSVVFRRDVQPQPKP